MNRKKQSLTPFSDPTVPGADLVIAACAWEHGVEIEHDDAHLAALADLFD